MARAKKSAAAQKKEAAAGPSTLPTPTPSPTPTAQPVIAAPAGPVKPHAVDIKDYKDGSFKMVHGEHKGKTFKLRIVKDDPLGRTHHLKNETHFWEGTEADFRYHFEKE